MIIHDAVAFDILLVEDEPADASLVRAALQSGKVLCNLHHVVDGLDALEFLRRQGAYANAPKPDLILLDLNMPRMNGHEFLAAAKTDDVLESIPVVVLTTSDTESDVATSYKLGAAGYVTKPVDMEHFIDAIRQVGTYWFALAKLPSKD